MTKFPGTIKVKIQHPELPDWYATSLKLAATPEKTVEMLNKMAIKQGTQATYTLATEDQYWAYRDSLKKAA
jgi:hypothetical protein